MKDATPITTHVLAQIAALYKIESEIRDQPPDARQRARQTHAEPIVTALRVWLREQLPTVSRKSKTADAIGYAMNQWQALTRYLRDGRIEIDNNTAERALRGVALGRKNFLFLSSDAGGERAATMYSLLGTAKLNDINPEAYLSHVLIFKRTLPDFVPNFGGRSLMSSVAMCFRTSLMFSAWFSAPSVESARGRAPSADSTEGAEAHNVA